jgi:hypothetical protein
MEEGIGVNISESMGDLLQALKKIPAILLAAG